MRYILLMMSQNVHTSATEYTVISRHRTLARAEAADKAMQPSNPSGSLTRAYLPTTIWEIDSDAPTPAKGEYLDRDWFLAHASLVDAED